MHSSTSQQKASKGSVQIKSSNFRLQLVFSFGGKRHYLSLGLPDHKTNRKVAEARARQIELDIISGNFDVTLAKYKPESSLSTLTPTTTPTELEKITTIHQTKRALMQLSAACKWAKKHGLMDSNPYDGLYNEMPKYR